MLGGDNKCKGMATSSSMVAVDGAKDTALPVGYQYYGLYKNNPGDKSKRATTYMIMGSTRFLYAAAARVFILKLLATWNASADVLALSSVEYDVGSLEPGDATTIKWRGKPIFIRHLTSEEIATVEAEDMANLRDVETHADRTKQANMLVCLGVCTHLGCVPIAKAGDWNGYFCPCHGSHYDASGRIMKGPAPENLEIPEYKFMTETEIQIG